MKAIISSKTSNSYKKSSPGSGLRSRAAVQADVRRIIEIYQREGQFDVSVVPKIIDRPNNRIDLVFEINEGEKTGIKSIVFVGNKAYSAWRLKEVIKTTKSTFISFLQTTDVYDPDRIEADRDLIRRFYLKHGYADVQVVRRPASTILAERALSSPSPSRKVRCITSAPSTFSPTFAPLTAHRQGDFVGMGAGQIYNGEAVEKTVEAMTIELARRGYPFGRMR